ncbi:hypothetical protein BABINDRAFT_7784 [Babjeviella inositovora NRRL Y-12698]|uniref:GPI inositol-deacylase n=1 Tax=Babjeviella inositovora NRRL Y-12698 TaxID=984486 RepID=A0A1E3QS66_9ASCO|nr:uncharacterized protein BABINDRAFT_7784 [Babjeviella inositovora NRRL Y-12698]ODQ80344.1 hypothetical protein BABINDRAFT_7784 [Babjeviella inositovora NRRL Y-12698]
MIKVALRVPLHSRSVLPQFVSLRHSRAVHLSQRLRDKEKKLEIDHQEEVIVDKFGKIRDDYKAPRYPLILCHGFSGFDRLILVPSFGQIKNYVLGKTSHSFNDRLNSGLFYFDYWYGIREALEEQGSSVLTAKVPPFGTIAQRAARLNEFINAEMKDWRKEDKQEVYNDETEASDSFKHEKIKVNLVAHSMGGLDCRYLISKLKHGNYEVVSLTTVSTPHRGSPMADYCMDFNKKLKNVLFLPPSISQLTTAYLEKFNEKVLDDLNVQYFSYGSRFTPSWYNVFDIPWGIINKTAGDNDGMVPVASAKWGKYLGTLENVDHLDLINWTNGARRAWTTNILHQEEKFNPVALYLDIADNLAREGL